MQGQWMLARNRVSRKGRKAAKADNDFLGPDDVLGTLRRVPRKGREAFAMDASQDFIERSLSVLFSQQQS